MHLILWNLTELKQIQKISIKDILVESDLNGQNGIAGFVFNKENNYLYLHTFRYPKLDYLVKLLFNTV
jgi:hypothetical protein